MNRAGGARGGDTTALDGREHDAARAAAPNGSTAEALEEDAAEEVDPVEWPLRPDWWPDPPDAREVLGDEDESGPVLARAAEADEQPDDASSSPSTRAERAPGRQERQRDQRPPTRTTGATPSVQRGPQERREHRERRDSRPVDPPTLAGLPNHWAQLPPTVPKVPETPQGIRRSTVLLIILWVAILLFYLWVRPIG
jgi:hypothetical protein